MIEFSAGRPATRSSSGMVTSPHALASEAGAAVLRDGGTAVDAAVATSAALSVLYPHMTGIGGDAFWLIYDAAANAVRYIDGGGRATSRGTIEAFTRRGLAEVPYKGPLPGTLTVPGAVASWGMAHAAYGRLPLKRCLESAIGYARDGFPVTARLAHWRDAGAGRSVQESGSGGDLPPGRRGPHQPRPRAHVGGDRQRRLVRLLRRRGGARAGALFRCQRRLLHLGRPQGPVGALGRADQGQLSRRHDLRDAGPDPGLRRAQDAEPAGTLRAAQKAVPRARRGASDGAGQAARLSRPRPPSRRSALRRRADGPAGLQGLRRRTAGADGSRPRPAVGSYSLLRQPLGRHGLHCRRRQGRQRGLADPFGLRQLRRGGGRGPHRRGAAEPLGLFLARSRRVPIASSRARRPCTR